MRIVRLANFVTPSSGGLRTALRELGRGYAEAGHEPVLVIPGPAASEEATDQGHIITLPGRVVPGLGGYRVLTDRARLVEVLIRLNAARLEVSDRSTLRWTGKWARARGVPAAMVSHESLDGLLRVARLPAPVRRTVARRLNRATARDYARVVCTTAWAAQEFRSAGARNVVEVPLGVDLSLFHPARRSEAVRLRYARPDEVLLVCCTRLSVEKRPERALRTVKSLLANGISVRLVMVGDGPLRHSLHQKAAGLPVTFAGYLADREALADLLASADVVLAPGPIETFGLAALESLASGTPVVVSASSALPAIVDGAGVAVAGEDLSPGVRELLTVSERTWRARARARAELFTWGAAARGFLAVHEELA